MLTLCLLFLAESVTFANARTLWSKTDRSFSDNSGSRTTPNDPFSQQQQQANEEFNNNNNKNNNIDGNTCSPPLPPISSSKKARGAFGRFFSIVGDMGRATTSRNNNFSILDDCCRDCYSCMDPRHAQSVCQVVPRGGHGIHHAAQHVVEAAVLAAAEGGSAVIATPYGIPLNGWKVIFQAILTTINVLCWLIPLRSKKISENKLALSLANAFSGGVFLSLAFGHLIPECVHGFHNYNEVTPYMLVLSGYLLIFFVEKVAFDAHDILHEMEHGGGISHDHSGDKSHSHSHGNGAVAAANPEKPVATTGRSALILLGALAVHSILEMAALGLADTFGDCALLTLSIALHQVRPRRLAADTLRHELLFSWNLTTTIPSSPTNCISF
jgi:hypothetical protein